MRVVPFEGEVREAEVGDLAYGRVEDHAGKRARFAGELKGGLIEVIFVEVEIPEGVDKFARLKRTDLGHHEGQERIGGDVEGDPQKKIGAPLIKLTAESAARHVELEKGMTGREGHLMYFAGIPRRDDQPTTVRILADLGDDVGDLVEGAPVRGPPVGPLGAIDSAEVALRIGPLVPDGDALGLEGSHVGVSAKEPEELVDDALEVQLFGGQKREALGEVEAGLGAKNGERAGAGAVFLRIAAFQNQTEQFVILAHDP
ncbi:MAG: hypothetical protein RLZZ142_286 [Verrucomicrobiota bacterium]